MNPSNFYDNTGVIREHEAHVKPKRNYRAIEARRLSLTERTQRYLDVHPEFLPEPIAITYSAYVPCRYCKAYRPENEMIAGCCSFRCVTNSRFENTTL